MAGWLTRRRRLWPLLVIVSGVLLAHGGLVRSVQQMREDAAVAEAMPMRLTAAFVRELVQHAPVRPQTASLPVTRSLRAPVELEAEAARDPAAPLEPLPERADAPPLAEVPELPDLSEPGLEWPASTQLSYALSGYYRGEVQGQAQVQWIREGRHYQMHLDVEVGPSFAPLISRSMSSDGLLTSEGIAPQRFDEDTRVLLRERRRVTIHFEGQVLRLADGKPQPQPAGVQDAASQFVQLTWLFLTGREQLRPGLQVEMPLALPRRLYRWRYEVIGEEELATPMGPLQAWHLRPHSDTRHRASGDLHAEVWLAPSLQYLPVRLRISQEDGSYIDLMLKASPLQALMP
jgi:Protein of unknown function (DUF3108)